MQDSPGMGFAVSSRIQPESQAVPCVRTISGPRRSFTARAIFVFTLTLLQTDVVIVVRMNIIFLALAVSGNARLPRRFD